MKKAVKILIAVVIAAAVGIGIKIHADKVSGIKNMVYNISEDRGWTDYVYTYRKTDREGIYIVTVYYEREYGSYIAVYAIDVKNGTKTKADTE